MALGYVESGRVATLVTQIYLLKSWILLLLKIVTPGNLNHYMERPVKAEEERDGFVIFSFSSDSLQVWALTLVKLVLICCREKQAFIYHWMATYLVFSVVLSRRRWNIFISGVSSSGGWSFSGSGLNTSFLWASWVNTEPVRRSLLKPSARFLLVWWNANITNSHNRA